jgi:hypothetical protein|tara:strand:- start:1014 stop:1706 length:693 start_codon:yes stop_codon:yes gene_type:complete
MNDKKQREHYPGNVNEEPTFINEIKLLIGKATNLHNEEKYFDAYSAWDDVITRLNQTLLETQGVRQLSKGAGWVAAFLTGGLGPSDLIIIPAVNKALLWLFDIDLEFVMKKLSVAVRQRQACLYYEEKLTDVSDYLEEITYFAYSYAVANAVNDNSEKTKRYFKLINPLHKENVLKFKNSEPELYEEINEVINNGRINKEIRIINQYLKKYMELKKKTNNIVYDTLAFEA